MEREQPRKEEKASRLTSRELKRQALKLAEEMENALLASEGFRSQTALGWLRRPSHSHSVVEFQDGAFLYKFERSDPNTDKFTRKFNEDIWDLSLTRFYSYNNKKGISKEQIAVEKSKGWHSGSLTAEFSIDYRRYAALHKDSVHYKNSPQAVNMFREFLAKLNPKPATSK